MPDLEEKEQQLKKLEEKIGFSFKNRSLLLQAFVHRSFLNENRHFNLPSNERLEFLGDACLELIVSDFLFHQFPNEAEGKLTSLRSALVNTHSLAATARQLQLGDYLLLSRGEEKSGGRDSEHLLANTFEALLGACYLEAGLECCRQIITQFLLPKLERIIKEKLYQDPKSRLQELLQEKFNTTPHYKILDSWGPDHEKFFRAAVLLENRILGVGEGPSKQRAETAAAEKALKKLEKENFLR